MLCALQPHKERHGEGAGDFCSTIQASPVSGGDNLQRRSGNQGNTTVVVAVSPLLYLHDFAVHWVVHEEAVSKVECWVYSGV